MSSTPESSQPLVLLAEDDADTREMYRQFLTLSGLRIANAHNGHQAFDRAVELAPDVVVTDLALPGLDGFELCKQLKNDDRTSRIPVLAITGYSFGELHARAERAGFVKLLTKPCLPEVLLAEIRSVLEAPASPIPTQE